MIRANIQSPARTPRRCARHRVGVDVMLRVSPLGGRQFAMAAPIGRRSHSQRAARAERRAAGQGAGAAPRRCAGAPPPLQQLRRRRAGNADIMNNNVDLLPAGPHAGARAALPGRRRRREPHEAPSAPSTCSLISPGGCWGRPGRRASARRTASPRSESEASMIQSFRRDGDCFVMGRGAGSVSFVEQESMGQKRGGGGVEGGRDPSRARCKSLLS